ncbi:MAG: hypothetical protein N3A38_13410 [Planctomycetota bacterium]|nr:hypothetical protein [Planctomycetota bacterium]
MSVPFNGGSSDKKGGAEAKKAPASGIYVARAGTTVYIRVLGVGNLATAPALFDFAERQRADGYREFVFDLAECRGFDSSFMGTIVGIAAGLRAEARGTGAAYPEDAPRADEGGPGAGTPADASSGGEEPRTPGGNRTGENGNGKPSGRTEGQPADSRVQGETADGTPREPRHGFVAMVNVSQECLEMLQILGADRFVRLGGKADLSGLEMTKLPDGYLSREERVRLIMKAHESLVEMDRRNEARFGAFLRQLASELGKR